MLYAPAPCTVLQLYDETMCAVGDSGEKMKNNTYREYVHCHEHDGTFQYMLKTALYEPSKYVIV
jgi:hypothetical protein